MRRTFVGDVHAEAEAFFEDLVGGPARVDESGIDEGEISEADLFFAELTGEPLPIRSDRGREDFEDFEAFEQPGATIRWGEQVNPPDPGCVPDLSVPCPGPATVLDRFVFAAATPTAAHRVTIATLAQTIVTSQTSNDPVHTVCLEGHTDSVGGLPDNERLGQRRADAVLGELRTAIDGLSAGLSARLTFRSTSAGETRPVVPNTTSANRARNRRVEVHLNNRWTCIFFLEAAANARIPAAESLTVSNFVTDNALPTANTFAGRSTDPENFRVEVVTRSPTPPMRATLIVLRGGAQISSNTYDLVQGTGADSTKWRSSFLRLVSDTSDDAAAGNGAASDPNNQTILVRLGDTVRASFPAAAGPVTVDLPVNRPVNENDNGANPRVHDIRELQVAIVVFRSSAAAGGPSQTRAQVQTRIDDATERLAQAGIRISVASINMGGPGDPGVALPAALAGGFTETPGIVTAYNATELAVIGMKNGNANILDIFFIDTITTVPTATSYPAVRNGTANAAAKNFVVVSRGANVFSLAHEVMHILLNSPHRANEPATALFRGGTTPNKSVGGTKRIGPYPDAAAAGVGNADVTTIRGNAEALP